MLPFLKSFPARHPILVQTALWALPAILLGAFLRLCMLHYIPYGYWGSDSRSYFDFTWKLFGEHYLSLVEKRRFLYPIFVAVVSLLPGAPLHWLPWVQHAFGVVTLLPLAYVVRRNFRFWRWWIVPITILYAGLPVVLWYEQELLAETLFFAFLVWAFAGWTAWVREPERARSLRLWWCFLIPFACFILTKPSGRFYWPGLLLGLVALRCWRRLGRWQLGGLATVMLATLFVGSRQQGAWLFYVASFPLTQLDTPAHAEYKAQIRDLVEPLRRDIDLYYENDEVPFNFLENPGRSPERPLWARLRGDDAARGKLYMQLALEGIRAEPLQYLHLGLQRALASANLSAFKKERFQPGHAFRRFEDDYESARTRQAAGGNTPLPLALGYGSKELLPPYAEWARPLSPDPDGWPARFVSWCVHLWYPEADLVAWPERTSLTQARPTVLGCWLLVALLLSALPAYRSTLGVWSLAALGYLGGVFLVSQVNARYFGAVWPVFIPVLATLPDVLATLLTRARARVASLPAAAPSASSGVSAPA